MFSIVFKRSFVSKRKSEKSFADAARKVEILALWFRTSGVASSVP